MRVPLRLERSAALFVFALCSLGGQGSKVLVVVAMVWVEGSFRSIAPCL